MKKAIIAIVIVGVIAAIAAGALRRPAGDVIEVRTEVVSLRDLVAKVSATGHIEPETQVDITTDVAGRIIDLPVREGEDVREGDLLLQIDPAQFQASVNRSRAALSQARASEAQQRAAWEQADRDAKRFVALQESGTDFVTAAEVERAVTDAQVQLRLLEAAEHSVAQADANLEQALDQLGKTTIRAPMSGRITRLNVERGETAVVGTMNNPGSLLLTIADLSVMEAVIEVDETDIPEISIGDSASIEIDAFGDRRFSGIVTEIGNSSIVPINPSAGGTANQAIDFEVRIKLDQPPPGIRPDLSATADVITDTRTQVVAVPITSLTLMDATEIESIPNENLPAASDGLRNRDVEGVFLVEGEIVRFVPVEIGIAGDNYFEVISGLETGVEIVSGSFQAIRLLTDGSRIEIENTQRATDGGGGSSGDGA
ncbi:MAG: efflux RND transporter periplasmic adaptor subunit [Gemmatimonadota bacterium]|nr:efflux RND transporter periplasmic adaptor subunit [Gemmatimonadota bacterium]